MIFDYVSSFFTSAQWLRILLDIFLMIPLTMAVKRHAIPRGNWLIQIPRLLLVRDFLSFLVLHPVIFVVSDMAIAGILLMWMAGHNPRMVKPWLQMIVMGLATAIFSVLLIAVGPVGAVPLLAQFGVLAAWLWVGFTLFRFTNYNSPNAEFLMEYRIPFFALMMISRALLVFDAGLRSPVTQYILYPFTLAPLFYMSLSYLVFIMDKTTEREQYNVNYINSLFDFMRTIGNAMTERIEVKNIISYIIKSVTQYISADAGVVLLRDSGEEELNVASMEGFVPPPFEVPAIVKTKLTGVQRFFESTPVKMGETVYGEAARDNKAVFIRKCDEDPRMKANTRDDTLLISSIIVCPLIVNKEVFGVIGMIRRKKDNLFSELDFERSRVFVEYASLTLDSLYNYAQLLEKQEIEREVNIAADIQKKLLPTRTPKAISAMVHAFSRPAKGVSGDYYDIIPLNAAGKFAMVICDVAGKGVPASLIMVMIRTIIHTIGGARKNAAEVVHWINRGIAGRVDIERFATLSYLTYNPSDRLLEYSNAGHHPIMLLRAATGLIERVDSPGLPIGLERDSQYSLVQMTLEPGDICLSYTDGIIEAMNYKGEQYEEERLQKVFLESVELSPREIVDAIRKDVDSFVGQARQHDDMTLIVLKAR